MFRRRLKRLLQLALIVLGIALLAFAGVNLVVWWPARTGIVEPSEARPAQAALVLGAGVWPDGRPTPVLKDRLDTGLDLYRSGKVGKILCTGDHGQDDYDEVNAMRRYLEEHGVPPEDIFMDHAGFDTYDSMYRARQVFEVQSAVVVTQEFHLPRALYLARSMGIRAEGVSATRQPYLDDGWYSVRELAARVKAFAEVAARREPRYLGPAIPIEGDGRATQG